MVFFSMGNLHEIFARITFVRRNFWEEARFLDSRGIEHTSLGFHLRLEQEVTFIFGKLLGKVIVTCLFSKMSIYEEIELLNLSKLLGVI